MRTRRTLAALGLSTVIALGVAAWARPAVPSEAHDPSKAPGWRTPVPAQVEALLRRACFDCHSDDTRWPWYAGLPVASHLIARDVREGRAQLNWSLWEAYGRFDRAELLDKACERAVRQEMPPWQYRLLHREARLSSREVDDFCAWSRRESAQLAREGS
jgi:hypothetical protein